MQKKKKRLTLFEQQWREIRGKFNIRKYEFREWYDSIRRANKKTARLRKQGSTLKAPKLSTQTTYIRNRKDFTKSLKKIKNILRRDYRETSGTIARGQFYKNLRKIFGRKDANILIDEFDELSQEQLKFFIDENPD